MVNEKIIMKSKVLRQIKETIGSFSPETGGIIGLKDNVISQFYYDNTAYSDTNCYIPDIVSVNKLLEEWQANDIEFYGIVHSHPQGEIKLSYTDKCYAQKILDCMDSTYASIYFPVVQSKFNGNDFKIYSYAVRKLRNEYKVFSVNLTII